MSHIFFVGQQQWGTKQDVSLLDNPIWDVYIPLSFISQEAKIAMAKSKDQSA